MKIDTTVNGAFKIMKKMLRIGKVNVNGPVKIPTKLISQKGYIRSGKLKILRTTHQLSIGRKVSKRNVRVLRKEFVSRGGHRHYEGLHAFKSKTKENIRDTLQKNDF